MDEALSSRHLCHILGTYESGCARRHNEGVRGSRQGIRKKRRWSGRLDQGKARNDYHHGCISSEKGLGNLEGASTFGECWQESIWRGPIRNCGRPDSQLFSCYRRVAERKHEKPTHTGRVWSTESPVYELVRICQIAEVEDLKYFILLL